MTRRSLSAFVLFAAVSLPPLVAGQETLASEALERLYSRPTNFFAETVLLKPLSAENARPFFSFAPLLLHQGIPSSSSNLLGMLSLSNGNLHVHTHPVIYAALDTLELGPGRIHPRYTYLWCDLVRDGGAAVPQPRLQGIRVTLDTQGRPAVWEVLDDSSGARLLFVSESLENAAAVRYGKALRGRRYALEQSLSECPDAVVVRVLDDGPVPMGPIVYVEAGTGDVSTVICRCMPAQARAVTQTLTYELLPFAGHEALLLRARGQMKNKPVFWPGENGAAANLSSWLRLPETW